MNGAAAGRTIRDLSVLLDGYVTGPEGSRENPFGVADASAIPDPDERRAPS